MPAIPPLIPGRSCPVVYRYGARALAAPAKLYADSLWIAGGLYGSIHALGRLEEMFAAERGESALIFNGDFHCFDVADEAFSGIEHGVSLHVATRGNVETEISQPQAGAGCGCGYPDWVGDQDVARSNRIIERLKDPVRPVLAAQPFVSAAAPGIADYILFGPFQWARSISPVRLLEPDDPMYAWRERMLDLFDGMPRSTRGYPVWA